MMRKSKATRNTVIALVVIALAAYVLVGFGQGTPTAQSDLIAKLGSVKIRLRDAWIHHTDSRNQFSQFDPETVNQMAVSQLITDAVFLDGAKKTGVSVSDEELRDFVIRYRTSPSTGFLDDESWANYIRSNYLLQVPTFEAYLKDYTLRSTKFRQLFLDGAYISNEEIEKHFIDQNRQVKLEMLVLSTFEVRSEVQMTDDEKLKKFFEENQDAFMTGDLRQIRFVNFNLLDYQPEIEVADPELENYYNENLERYRKAEQVQASHILIKTENRSDEEALAEVQKIRKEIVDGLDFAEAATKYSEDQSNSSRGGDLGFFGRGRMVPAFESAAFSMNIGDLSEPVKTQFGYHLIKKTGHEQEAVRPLEEVSASIKANIQRNKARDYVKTLANGFLAKVNEGLSFEAAAEALEYTVHTSTFFDSDNRSNLGEVLKNNFNIRRAAFALEEINEISDVVEGGTQVAVIQWIAEKEPEPLSFEEDKDRIKGQAEDVGAKKFIEDLFEEFRTMAAASPDKSFKELKGDRAFLKDNHFRETDWFGSENIPWEIRSEDIDFERDIYNHEPGSFLENATGTAENRFALARLVEKREPDMSKLEEERTQIVEQLRQEQGGDLLRGYFFARMDQYDPDDRIQGRIRQFINQR